MATVEGQYTCVGKFYLPRSDFHFIDEISVDGTAPITLCIGGNATDTRVRDSCGKLNFFGRPKMNLRLFALQFHTVWIGPTDDVTKDITYTIRGRWCATTLDIKKEDTYSGSEDRVSMRMFVDPIATNDGSLIFLVYKNGMALLSDATDNLMHLVYSASNNF